MMTMKTMFKEFATTIALVVTPAFSAAAQEPLVMNGLVYETVPKNTILDPTAPGPFWVSPECLQRVVQEEIGEAGKFDDKHDYYAGSVADDVDGDEKYKEVIVMIDEKGFVEELSSNMASDIPEGFDNYAYSSQADGTYSAEGLELKIQEHFTTPEGRERSVPPAEETAEKVFKRVHKALLECNLMG